MKIVNPRLTPGTFRLPLEKIRAGYKSDIYFVRSKLILEADGERSRTTMQLFQKHPDVSVVGLDQVLAMLYQAAGHYSDVVRADALFAQYLQSESRLYGLWSALPATSWEAYQTAAKETFEISSELARLWVSGYGNLKVQALYDGERAGTREAVMHIEGIYSEFAHLETMYLGALAEGTRVATNTRTVVEAANGKPVLFFAARHQPHELQAGDGYAAYIGGASGVSTDESGEWWGASGIGTSPHALIAAYGGDTTLATLKFEQFINGSTLPLRHLTGAGSPTGRIGVTPLVDFDNDVVGTSLKVAKALGEKLYGVRVDTSETNIDKGLLRAIVEREGFAGKDNNGVTPELVRLLRTELDAHGYEHVKIVVSGGFSAEKIRRFENAGVPADIYGVGSSLVHGDGFDFTADIVLKEGKPVAKVGREYLPSERLHPVDWDAFARGVPTGA